MVGAMNLALQQNVKCMIISLLEMPSSLDTSVFYVKNA